MYWKLIKKTLLLLQEQCWHGGLRAGFPATTARHWIRNWKPTGQPCCPFEQILFKAGTCVATFASGRLKNVNRTVTIPHFRTKNCCFLMHLFNPFQFNSFTAVLHFESSIDKDWPKPLLRFNHFNGRLFIARGFEG
jgi:hypothetical protein